MIKEDEICSGKAKQSVFVTALSSAVCICQSNIKCLI